MISVVIPLFNERESLAELVAKLVEVLERDSSEFELIFVDDGSTDGSFDELKRLREKEKRIRIVRFRRNFGKAAGLAEGFRRARGEVVITMDADLQDAPEEIPNLIAKLDEGYDLVSGWKKERKDPITKRWPSKLYNLVTSAMTGIRLHDFNCGLKGYRREVIDSIAIYGQLHRYIPALAHLQGFRVTEIPVRHHARRYGKSKFGAARFASGLFDLTTVLYLSRFNRRPLHLFGGVGLFSLFLGMLVSAWLAYERILYQKYLSNRPLLFLGILLIIVGVQFISIGLLGEMITEARKRDFTYSIREEVE